MKKLILLSAAILISCQLLGQMSKQPEFSTWVKTECVANIAYICDEAPESCQNLGQVAQTRQQKMAPWKITAIAVFAVTTEAVGDGFYDQGKTNGNQNQMMAGKALQATSLASHFLYIEPMRNSNTNWLLVPIVEACWRYVLFDLVYNVVRGLPFGYIGNTTFWDKGIQTFAPPMGMRLFSDAIIATFTISLTFDKF